MGKTVIGDFEIAEPVISLLSKPAEMKTKSGLPSKRQRYYFLETEEELAALRKSPQMPEIFERAE